MAVGWEVDCSHVVLAIASGHFKVSMGCENGDGDGDGSRLGYSFENICIPVREEEGATVVLINPRETNNHQ